MNNDDSSYIDYLEVKKTIDDTALNSDVFEQFRQDIISGFSQEPISVVELGAGTGTMIERLLDQHMFRSVHYTAVDINPTFLSVIPERLQRYAQKHHWEFTQENQSANLKVYRLTRSSKIWRVTLVTADLFDFIDEFGNSVRWDLLLAHAVLDLVPIPDFLPSILSLLKPNGSYYFTLNYDGVTNFLPIIDYTFDAKYERVYNNTMMNRTAKGKPIAGANSGRLLLSSLPASGATISACGSSDWIVHPGKSGYSQTAKKFLGYMLDTFKSALQEREDVNGKQFSSWMEKRFEQLDQEVLSFIAHQLDFFGHVE